MQVKPSRASPLLDESPTPPYGLTMKWCRCLLVGWTLAMPLASLHAGILFNRKPRRTRPSVCLSSLVLMSNGRAQSAAAAESARFDGNADRDHLGPRADAAMKDPQVSVRIERCRAWRRCAR